MQDSQKKIVWGAVAVITWLVGFALSGVIAVVAQALGLAAYPTFFALGMLLSWLVMCVPWFRHRVEGSGESKFSKGFWVGLRRKGAFWTVLAATFILGPIGAALAARFLGLSDRKAWKYIFICNLISVAVFISLYLGAFRVLKMIVFGHH